MRYIVDCNPQKRGCGICADVIKIDSPTKNGYKTKACPYDECPYHELDQFEKYTDYDKHAKQEGKNHLESWLKKVFNLSEK